jgi:ketosteroid isomerase-like protein
LRENRRVPTPRDAEIREAYARFATGDVEGALRLFSADAAYVNPVAALEPGTRRGIDEVASALRSIHEQIDFDQIEVRDIAEGPGCLLVTLRVEGRGRISGAPVDQLFYHVLRFADEQVTAFEWYTGRDEGVGAAGLG